MPTIVHEDFEWDSDKADANLAKHSVSFEEAVTVLLRDDSESFEDAQHDDRVVTIGWSIRARTLFVVTTETTIRTRIISARGATPAEHSRWTTKGKS